MGQKFRQLRTYRIAIIGTITFSAGLFSSLAYAISYGVYDARSMAMGGTGVASANSSSAIFYNPSLYATYGVKKEKADNQRLHFPLITAQASKAILDLASLQGDSLDSRLTDAIDAFNASASDLNAAAAAAAARDFEDALQEVANKDLIVDGFVGLSLGVPNKWEGGGLFIGSRLIGGGVSDITNEDLSILNDYVEGLTFVATNGEDGSLQPQIFDANGNLIDPVDQLTSTASARGAAFTEVGFAMSKRFELFDRYIALGITPKFSHITLLEYEADVTTGGVVSERKAHEKLNLDVGANMLIGDTYRLGLAVKNLVPYDLTTELENTIKLRPQVRAGLTYQYQTLLMAIDLDLLPNEPIGFEERKQELAFGVEWAVRDWVWLRGGYRFNLEGETGNLFSLGLGMSFKGFLFDVACGRGRDDRVAALQLGLAF